jgi:hypothetical protein
MLQLRVCVALESVAATMPTLCDSCSDAQLTGKGHVMSDTLLAARSQRWHDSAPHDIDDAAVARRGQGGSVFTEYSRGSALQLRCSFTATDSANGSCTVGSGGVACVFWAAGCRGRLARKGCLRVCKGMQS